MGRKILWIQSIRFFRNRLLTLSDDGIESLIKDLKSRAKKLEESIIDISVRTEGAVSLTEAYSMPFKVRDMYYRLHKKYIDDKNNA